MKECGRDGEGVGEGREHVVIGVLGKGLVFRVFRHADNFRSVAAAPEPEMATYCFIGGPEDLACKFAIDDGHDRSLVVIVRGEGTARQKCRSSSTEIVGRDLEILGIGCSVGRTEIGGGINE